MIADSSDYGETADLFRSCIFFLTVLFCVGGKEGESRGPATGGSQISGGAAELTNAGSLGRGGASSSYSAGGRSSVVFISYSVLCCTSMAHLITFSRIMTDKIR
jgi:hypothetical protein